MKLRIEKLEPTSELDYSRVLLLLPSKDEATAEDLSMLQALYSRDPRPIDDSVRLAKTSKSGEFMNRFYVGYGHSSIAECGSFTIAIEGVPMIIAKLIQHNQLYRGQECSTRYLDFSKQKFISPSDFGNSYQEKLRTFYMKWISVVTENIINSNSLDITNKSDARTARACAFDVMRGFLPIGASTNLSWSTDIKNFNDHVSRLRTIQDIFYGLKEVLDKMVSLVREEYPNSIFESKDDGSLKFYKNDKYFESRDTIKTYYLMTDDCFVERFGIIDFASWRDLARHRSIFQSFPRINSNKVHSFYLNNIPEEAKIEFNKLHKEMINNSNLLSIYDFPMGCEVDYYFSGYLSKLKYILKLRSSHTVHPSLRKEILNIADRLNLTDIIKEENRTTDWIINPKRGEQTINKINDYN